MVRGAACARWRRLSSPKGQERLAQERAALLPGFSSRVSLRGLTAPSTVFPVPLWAWLTLRSLFSAKGVVGRPFAQRLQGALAMCVGAQPAHLSAFPGAEGLAAHIWDRAECKPGSRGHFQLVPERLGRGPQALMLGAGGWADLCHRPPLLRWRSGGSACPGFCPRPPWLAPCAMRTTVRSISAVSSPLATTWLSPAPF